MSERDNDAALSVNREAFNALDEKRLVAESPHLNHATIRRLYEETIDEVVGSMRRNPRSLSVLELGAGDGSASGPWFTRGASVTAVDCSAVMLDRLSDRAAGYGSSATTVLSDAVTFLQTCERQFDIVTHVSVLHHVPDYLSWVAESVRVLAPGGCLLTFQDPLRYDRIPHIYRLVDRAAYFGWRVTRGNYRRGLKTRLRRLKGIYSEDEEADYEEYHVVRNGVDSEALITQLKPQFEAIRRIDYWSTQGSFWQMAGEKLGIRTSFGIVALKRIAIQGQEVRS